MFPLRWNFPFRKKDGSMSTVEDALGGGSYELPVATASVLGGIKVGSGLSIADGVLSATSSGGGGGHCYHVSTNNTGAMRDIILFTGYDGSINDRTTLAEAFGAIDNFNGIAIPYASRVVIDGKIILQIIRGNESSLLVNSATITDGALSYYQQSITLNSLTSVTSTKIW